MAMLLAHTKFDDGKVIAFEQAGADAYHVRTVEPEAEEYVGFADYHLAAAHYRAAVEAKRLADLVRPNQ